ncbi:VIT1/CCC1 transporter family protein [Gramella jeungdoensis]|uniref:VIT1/CCC1 transporter family protein n=1 Tax=Gramella jeungdoensis TaxID=708091 RepID=A0ABT0Z1B2_9FLAO|nr:VIT1/CCC1 transporter family protein [Gramella jeungdoensis]MCM8568589.1 VIT1/CCC1 transporter family protein [Gramella jeungdoensis]
MTKYQHSRNTSIGSKVREVIFGMEDGMVSTLGAITGIAIGSQDQFTVILSGTVIIAVESVSMAIGSYISNRSEYEINQGRIEEEKEEIRDFAVQEKKELFRMFVRDGWPLKLAREMTSTASKDPDLMLKEMTYRELLLAGKSDNIVFKKSVLMFISYIVGGLFPLVAYLIFPIKSAMPVSIGITMIGLFIIGSTTTRFSKVTWYKAGTRVLLLGLIALVIGYLIGQLAIAYK